MKKTIFAAALLAASFMPATASAQDAETKAMLVAGATVYGPEGEEVGTITDVSSGNVVVDTGTHEATLPANVFGRNDTGPKIAFTKAQLDDAIAAAAAQTNAARDAALVANAEVQSNDGIVVGKIREVNGANVIIQLTDGSSVAVTNDTFSLTDGKLAIATTADEFRSAVSAADGS